MVRIIYLLLYNIASCPPCENEGLTVQGIQLTMLAARVLSLLILLCSSYLSAIAQPALPPHVSCSLKETVGLNSGPRPILNDCHAAINMIPDGGFFMVGGHRDDPKPIKLHITRPLTADGQHRTFLMPAMFRSGTCVVTVHCDDGYVPPRVPTQPTFPDAAAWMYIRVWPNVRHQAQVIMWACFEHDPDPNTRYGEAGARTLMPHGTGAGAWFSYRIRVSRVPPNGFPGDGWRYLQRANIIDISALDHYGSFRYWELEYNVYEPGGSSSGHGTKGVWGSRTPSGQKPKYHGQHPWLFA